MFHSFIFCENKKKTKLDEFLTKTVTFTRMQITIGTNFEIRNEIACRFGRHVRNYKVDGHIVIKRELITQTDLELVSNGPDAQ